MVTEMLNLMKMMMESTLLSLDTTDAASNQGMEDTNVLQYVHWRGYLPTIADTTMTTSFLWSFLYVQVNAKVHFADVLELAYLMIFNLFYFVISFYLNSIQKKKKENMKWNQEDKNAAPTHNYVQLYCDVNKPILCQYSSY